MRFARPTDQLGEVVRFPCKGLGLPFDRFAGHARYRGVLLGLPYTQYHLEFTQHDHGSPGPAPSRDNLLVPGRRRRGIATALVNRIAPVLRARGVERLEVTANLHALGFYRAAGFIDCGVAVTVFSAAPRMVLEIP